MPIGSHANRSCRQHNSRICIDAIQAYTVIYRPRSRNHKRTRFSAASVLEVNRVRCSLALSSLGARLHQIFGGIDSSDGV